MIDKMKRKDRPLQNRNYYKTPNGCGSYGFNFNLQIYGLNFNQCCYKHDLCYGSCNSVKQTCDEQFYSCALSECNRCGNSVKYVACKSFAKVMFRVTRTTGCTAYQRDQEMACSCSSY